MGDTYKLTTLVGESPGGIQDAVSEALTTSASKVHGHSWAQVKDIRVNLGADGQVELWQVELEVAFKVDA